jgi:hypothetical protein
MWRLWGMLGDYVGCDVVMLGAGEVAVVAGDEATFGRAGYLRWLLMW